MTKRKVYCIAFAILASPCLKAGAEGRTHCRAGEVSMWSCPSKNKMFELCASQDLSKSSGYLQYRTGRIGKIEWVYPAERVRPQGLFTLHLYARNAALLFQNDRYRYELFDALTGGSELRVYERDKGLISEISCNATNETFTSTQVINQFREIGLYK